MSRELLLLRHGKADRVKGLRDIDRPLKDRGKRSAQRIGQWLLGEDLKPDHVVSSPAERAKSTAQKCLKVMGIGVDRIAYDRRIHKGDVGQLIEVIRDCPRQAARILLVGHNPGLEKLLERLAGNPLTAPGGRKLLPTAALARLAVPEKWNKLAGGECELLGITRPSTLPELFPFPSPDSTEQRERPAYYYTQSGVIPFRLRGKELEVMIVRSSGNRHWTLPKGIADPGLSLEESALKEAWEEGGVEGRVLGGKIGQYRYDKWGATCTVSVYAMEVDKQLSKKDWEESHRTRSWVGLSDAAAMLKQRALAPIVLSLGDKLKNA